MMIHSSTTSVVEPTTFLHTATLYFAVSITNAGYADGPASTASLYIDNVAVASHVFQAMAPGGFTYSNNIYSAKLSAGTHTIKLVCNPGNTLHETNYTNNTYSRTITVQ